MVNINSFSETLQNSHDLRAGGGAYTYHEAVAIMYIGRKCHQYSTFFASRTWGGGKVLRISSDGDDQRIFLGLKFSIPGFFWVGKFGKYFLGWRDSSGDFFGYSKQSEDLW